MKAFTALDSWLFQKSGSFKNFVKNEVTVDATGMMNIPIDGLCLTVITILVYHIIRRRLCVTRSTK